MSRRKRRQLNLSFSASGSLQAEPRPLPRAATRPREEPDLGLGYARLRRLYELSKLLTSYDGPDSVPELLQRVAQTVPLRIALVLDASARPPRLVAARAATVGDQELAAAIEHAGACVARLSGVTPAPALVTVDPAPLQLATRLRKPPARGSFAALPLVQDLRAVMGVLYVRGGQPLVEADLAFLSAAADQLSLASDRHAAWQREIRLRERAEALDRAQKELIAVVSHDLRNPLGAVMLGISTLRKWPTLSAETLREHLDTIHRAAERASTLVHDLLDVARLDAGIMAVSLEPIDLAFAIGEAAELMKPLLDSRGLRCETQVEENLAPVLADRERILQVFSNLIGNAMKFSREGDAVSLLAWQEDGEARCCVGDDGSGIPAADLPRIFERYFQGPHGPTAHGAGLGLSIAKGIVEAQGGRIWVESHEGQGSRFFFTVPFAS